MRMECETDVNARCETTNKKIATTRRTKKDLLTYCNNVNLEHTQYFINTVMINLFENKNIKYKKTAF